MLDELVKRLANDYETIELHDDGIQYFRLSNGIIFYLVFFPDDNFYTVSYANDIEDAKKYFFTEGDQFDGDWPFGDLLGKIKEELEYEPQ